MWRGMHRRIYGRKRLANSMATCLDIVAAVAVAVKIYEPGLSGDADGNHRRDKSATAPKERQ